MKLYRPATVFVGILFVLLGGLARFGDPEKVYDDDSRIITKGSVGQRLDLRGSTVEITSVKFAKSYFTDNASSEDPPVRTNGIFIAVEYDAVPGPKPLKGGLNVTLTTDGGSEYVPLGTVSNDIRFPAAGFAQNGGIVFEANPADLKGLTLRAHPTQFFTVLGQDLAIDLGVPSEEVAQQSVDNAVSEYQLPKADVRVAS